MAHTKQRSHDQQMFLKGGLLDGPICLDTVLHGPKLRLGWCDVAASTATTTVYHNTEEASPPHRDRLSLPFSVAREVQVSEPVVDDVGGR